MNDVVERVAKMMLLDELSRTGHQHNFDTAWNNEGEVWLLNSRAAIQAMREPSPKMIEAAGGETVNLWRADDPSYEPRDVWQTMIDAALADASPDIGKEGIGNDVR